MSNLSHPSTIQLRLYGLQFVAEVVQDKRPIFSEPSFGEIYALALNSYGNVDKEDANAIRYLLLTDHEIYSLWRSRAYRLQAIKTLCKILTD